MSICRFSASRQAANRQNLQCKGAATIESVIKVDNDSIEA